MFWSKIWFFLVAIAGAVALTIALVLPQPAARAMVTEEQRRLTVACGVIGILLTDDARNRVDLAGSFARTPEVINALESASAATTLDEARMKQVRGIGEAVMKTIQGNRKPDFAMLVDRRGRVVARVRFDDGDFGDVVAGRPLVDDALAGYLRDDLWTEKGSLYFVSASPVIKAPDYVGAIVLGHQVTNELAQKLVGSLGVDVGFYASDSTVASSKPIALDAATMKSAVGALRGGDLARDCQANQPMALRAGTEDYTGIVARLPGEAAARGAFYSVFIARPVAPGFSATLKVVRQNDFALDKLILVGGGFLLVLAGGIGLMLFESDRPLRRLTADAVRLAKGDSERLSEDAHPGKFGSIARSVNIHIDKLNRDAKSARKDLDQLLGPAPEGSLGSLGTIDLLATALPSVRPGGPVNVVPPPPSEFRFGDGGSASRPGMPAADPPVPAAGPPMPPRAHTPPAFPATPPPFRQTAPTPAVAPPPLTLDDDILGGPGASGPIATAPPVDPYFKQVYDQFLATKRSCGEPTTGLAYDKFAEKLVRNRDDLRAKTGCREVRFTVYVKDGKAALKATPVKDD